MRLHFEQAVDAASVEARFADRDIVVVADGVNSPIRQRFASEFGVSIIEQRNRFAWLGSTRPLDAFTFSSA